MAIQHIDSSQAHNRKTLKTEEQSCAVNVNIIARASKPPTDNNSLVLGLWA
jgi:hypothetical protein